MKDKISLTLFLTMCLAIILIFIFFVNPWAPWPRQSVVFYEPLIYPVEVLKGDIIVFTDNSSFRIEKTERINSIDHQDDTFTINATVRYSLWQLLTR